MINEETTRQRLSRQVGLVLLAMVATVLACFAAVEPAQAAFPGQNGKIALTSFRDLNDEIYTMNPDGSKQTNLSDNPASDSLPAVISLVCPRPIRPARRSCRMSRASSSSVVRLGLLL